MTEISGQVIYHGTDAEEFLSWNGITPTNFYVAGNYETAKHYSKSSSREHPVILAWSVEDAWINELIPDKPEDHPLEQEFEQYVIPEGRLDDRGLIFIEINGKRFENWDEAEDYAHTLVEK